MTAPPLAIDARDGNARTGRLHTAHGVVETPNFMPVATYGAVSEQMRAVRQQNEERP